jgi:hypothetical protein
MTANYKVVGYDFAEDLSAAADCHICAAYIAFDATIELDVTRSCDCAFDYDIGANDRRNRGRPCPALRL